MTNLRHVLAINMKEKRSMLGLSQAKLAEKINTAPTYIAMIELGEKIPLSRNVGTYCVSSVNGYYRPFLSQIAAKGLT